MGDFQDLLLEIEQEKVATVSYVQEHKVKDQEMKVYKVEESWLQWSWSCLER